MSSPNIPLTEGICERLNASDKEDEELWNTTPTVQFLSIKKVASSGASGAPAERHRIIMSDGVHFVQAMLATQLNYMVEENLIGKNTIAIIERMTGNMIQEKRLVVILGLKVLQREAAKIGSPAPLNSPPGQAQQQVEVTTPASTSSVPARAPAVGQQQRAAGGRGPSVFPIEALSPYQNNWRIKARVIQKSDIKTYANQRGDGKLFSVTLMDDTGEIKATAFNAVVDDFYDKLQEDKVYFVSKARVNLAKKKFSTVSNEYELSLDRNTEIEECHETTNLPVIRYNFVKLSGLEELQKDAICDVIAVVKEVGEVSTITMKSNNKPLEKRELTLVDETGFSVKLTLWGKQAIQFNATDQPIIAFKGVKVGDFGGRSLGALSSSSMSINPDTPDAHALKGWFIDAGAKTSFQAHTKAGTGAGGGIRRDEMRTISDVKDAQLGMSDKTDWFSTRATIMHIKADNILYPACPSESCNKKVVSVSEGWRCEKCDMVYPHPQYRYMVSMAVADYTGQAWFSGFNDVGDLIFGMSGSELQELRERDESKATEVVTNAQCHTYNFSCKASQDSWNDQTRVRYGIHKIQPLDYAVEARAYVDLLHSAWAQ
ncbi:replication factor-a protein [Artomyces pyxidatus]|uniref:Replication factor-a protein n=1 Tax=Artomyces pyxidatus TaxID=48021 RepID=A0ACB8T8U6_9AGAM|nr:replication factor-a protein [Artomyces pyxidatus]